MDKKETRAYWTFLSVLYVIHFIQHALYSRFLLTGGEEAVRNLLAGL